MSSSETVIFSLIVGIAMTILKGHREIIFIFFVTFHQLLRYELKPGIMKTLFRYNLSTLHALKTFTPETF